MAEGNVFPAEALDLIPCSLTFDPDYIRFRSVCSSWRSAAPKIPLLPWLVGHSKDAQGKYTVLSFFKFPISRFRLSPIDELPECSPFGGTTCVGSSHGWLALLDFAGPSIILWNPVTKSNIQLPNLPVFSNYKKGLVYYETSPPGDYTFSYTDRAGNRNKTVHESSSPEDTQEFLASQVVLSSDPADSSDFVALAICCHSTQLVFCRPGDQVWTKLDCPSFSGHSTSAAFFQGRFYVASACTIYVCDDLLGPNPTVSRVAALGPGSCTFPPKMIDHSFLVESGGDLLLVLAFSPALIGKHQYDSDVYKVCWGEKVELSKMDSLGDMALFLSSGHPFSLPTESLRVRSLVRNSICYTEVFPRYENSGNWSNPAVCLLSDLTYSYPHDWKPCCWLKPSLLPFDPH